MGFPKFENINDNTDTYIWAELPELPSHVIEDERAIDALETPVSDALGRVLSVTPEGTRKAFQCQFLVDPDQMFKMRKFNRYGACYLYPDSDYSDKYPVMFFNWSHVEEPGGKYRVSFTLLQAIGS